MNDEIKEMLDYLKEFIDEDRLEQINLNRWFVSSLLDYITNLQQQLHQASLDIQELTEKDIECPSWCDKLTNLQQENKRLEKQLEYLRTDEYLNQVKWERNFNETMNKELKSRIEKAVEYIKEDIYSEPNELYGLVHGYQLLNILNGRSDE